MDSGVALIGGLLIGFSGSAHCAGICGGISSSLYLATTPDGAGVAERTSTLALLQFGRALSYVIAGAAVGAAGAGIGELAAMAGAQSVLRYVAAGMLIWVGLSICGVLPGASRFDSLLASLTANVARIPKPYAGLSPLAAGLLWGFAPCGMVYNALLLSMAGGSALGGAELMTGFALGTMPSIAATTFGATSLAGLARSVRSKPWLRVTMGLSLVGLAIFTVFQSADMAYCFSG
ncbi:sulfite exporter TauE/SafE family protein [Methyloligella sp. 2.7D]|uniref:sulfite exporter TauE/SafE family protein n=1 Tax=unclassified Methyloligella TaxID=2625955 RepID=UPI00157C6BD6|nr:sulfite exporter TauE/SafE family protein [Methyloligella sp. GL2]QKP78092.1 sulfite exporter TauE/SafE family protein [Methyloligella sp. GL2]